MSLRINHNISSMNGHRQLMKNQDMMSKSLERLSSGLRINRAADGASGLVISEQMRAQITGLSQAVSNSETAISMVQTTEGALDEVNSLLNKARELTLHANNSGANDTNQLAADQAELDNVIQTITRISDVTQFGTKKLLDGSLNGASSVGTNLSHIKVGNLANNAGIAAGSMTVAVVGGIKEGTTLNMSGVTTDSYVFTTATTGVTIGGGSVASGVVVTLAVASGSVAVTTVSGGGTTATALAAQLSTALSGAGLGYTVSASTSGAMVVSRSTAGATDFASSISLYRAGTAGTKESISSTLIANSGAAGTAAVAATAIFSSAALSGVTSASTVTSGTQFSYTINSATGTLTGSVTVGSGGSTMAVVLSGLQAAITAGANAFSGATLAFGSAQASSGLQFSLTRGVDTEKTDFNFTMSIDFKNNPNVQSEAHVLRLDTVAVYTGTATSDADATYNLAGSGALASDLTGSSQIGSGSAINLTINGQTFVATGGQALTAAAASLQAQAVTAGFTNTKVQFLATGLALSGTANPGYVGSTGSVPAGASFVVYNTDGKDFNVSLAVDQKVGVDVAAAETQLVAGAEVNATLNLTTATQVRTSGVSTQSDVTIASTTGGSSITSGVDTKATITTTSGLAISLVQSKISSSGVATLALTTGMQDLGFKDFSMEVASGYASGGGATSFTLNNGAEFQVGANALQLVGLAVSNSSSKELGRGASSTLSSLDSLLSSNSGALTNGLGSEALKVIDAAIDEITNQRGKLGAFQANTLESGLNSLRVSKENLTAAESTIRDVDFAEESAAFTRNQILVQASTSMLAQANQMPQNVLKLLG